MPFRVDSKDFNSKTWRDNRPSALKGCDVAKSLDAFQTLYKKGPQKTFDEGKMDQAISQSGAVAKALGKARVKANKVKKSADKKFALEVVDSFDRLNQSFMDVLLTANLDNSGKVLEQVMNAFANDVESKATKVEGAITKTRAAIRKPDAEDAVRQHGIALNYLKGMTDLATKSGLDKVIRREARGLGISVSEVNTKDKKLQTTFKKAAKRYKDLSTEVDSLDAECERLADAIADSEPQSPSTDPTYKKRLKKMQQLYKGVVDKSKRGLAKVKQFKSRASQLPRLVEAATTANAAKVVQAIEMIHNGMHENYTEVDTHIQETIRTRSSTFVVQRTEWGITTEDVNKNLAPLMNRAFALNYQCKAVWENGTDDLIGLLEDLLEKVDSDAARRAIARFKA